MINDIDFAKDGLQAEALSAIALITKHNLSKYNHAPELELAALPDGLDARVLVVDQTRGDMSVVLGGGEEGVAAMVAAALAEHPTAQIIVKTHPDSALHHATGSGGEGLCGAYFGFDLYFSAI